MTRTPEQVLKNLEAVEQLFSVDKVWVKGTSKFTKSDGTECYCLTGALGEVVNNDPFTCTMSIGSELKAMGFSTVHSAQVWNDNSQRTIKEIRERLAQGIERVKTQIKTGEPDVTKIPLTRVPMETQANLAATKLAAAAPPVDLQAVHDTAAAMPGNKKPKALKLKAQGPGVRKYPKGHPLGGKFVPASVTDEEANKIPSRETLIAYKGFNTGPNGELRCRDTFFKLGEEKNVSGNRTVRACEHGFHACENPFKTFDFYSFNPAHVYGRVTLLAPFRKESDKVAAKGIIVDEIFTFPHLLKLLAKFARENANDQYVKDWVALNSIEVHAKQWDLQTVDSYGYGNTLQINNSRYKMSNVPSARQFGGNSYSINMAFGKNSKQMGQGWKYSHADHVSVVHEGGGLVEVLGKDCTIVTTDRYTRIKATAGTRITYVDPSHSVAPITAVVGEKNLDPGKMIHLMSYPETTNKFGFKADQ